MATTVINTPVVIDFGYHAEEVEIDHVIPIN